MKWKKLRSELKPLSFSLTGLPIGDCIVGYQSSWHTPYVNCIEKSRYTLTGLLARRSAQNLLPISRESKNQLLKRNIKTFSITVIGASSFNLQYAFESFAPKRDNCDSLMQWHSVRYWGACNSCALIRWDRWSAIHADFKIHKKLSNTHLFAVYKRKEERCRGAHEPYMKIPCHVVEDFHLINLAMSVQLSSWP